MADIGAFAPAVGSIVLIDQALKAALLAWLPDGRAVRLGSLGRIRPFRATPVASHHLPPAVLLTAWVAVVALILAASSASELFGSGASMAALGVAAGGALSNVLDRLVRGGVVDYVDLRVWPAFNLADAAIVVGIAGAFLGR